MSAGAPLRSVTPPKTTRRRTTKKKSNGFSISSAYDHWGHLFARDAFAHELVDALCDMAKGFGTDPPTITMLRMVIKANNIPTLPVTFDELGIDPSKFFVIRKPDRTN